MRLNLFVDAGRNIRYYFSNGMILTVTADGEYQHTIGLELPKDVYGTKIEIMDLYGHNVEMTMTPDSCTIFKTSTVGWLHEMELSFLDMIK